MSETLFFLVGLGLGLGVATALYMRRILRLDTRNLNIINTPARSVSVDALIQSALGHDPLPRGSTIHDIPRQGGGRHRAMDDEAFPIAWPTQDGDQKTE